MIQTLEQIGASAVWLELEREYLLNAWFSENGGTDMIPEDLGWIWHNIQGIITKMYKYRWGLDILGGSIPVDTENVCKQICSFASLKLPQSPLEDFLKAHRGHTCLPAASVGFRTPHGMGGGEHYFRFPEKWKWCFNAFKKHSEGQEAVRGLPCSQNVF